MNFIRKIIVFIQQLGPAYRAGQAEQARQLELGRAIVEGNRAPVSEEELLARDLYLARRDGI